MVVLGGVAVSYERGTPVVTVRERPDPPALNGLLLLRLLPYSRYRS